MNFISQNGHSLLNKFTQDHKINKCLLNLDQVWKKKDLFNDDQYFKIDDHKFVVSNSEIKSTITNIINQSSFCVPFDIQILCQVDNWILAFKNNTNDLVKCVLIHFDDKNNHKLFDIHISDLNNEQIVSSLKIIVTNDVFNGFHYTLPKTEIKSINKLPNCDFVTCIKKITVHHEKISESFINFDNIDIRFYNRRILNSIFEESALNQNSNIIKMFEIDDLYFVLHQIKDKSKFDFSKKDKNSYLFYDEDYFFEIYRYSNGGFFDTFNVHNVHDLIIQNGIIIFRCRNISFFADTKKIYSHNLKAWYIPKLNGDVQYKPFYEDDLIEVNFKKNYDGIDHDNEFATISEIECKKLNINKYNASFKNRGCNDVIKGYDSIFELNYFDLNK